LREHERIAVQTDAYGMRLLDFLERRWPAVHRAYFRRLVLAELVKVNRIIGTPYTRLRQGDVVDITRPAGEPPPRPSPKAEAPARARLLHRGEGFAVVDVPAGVAVAAVQADLEGVVPAAARPVLRADVEASGVVLLADDAGAARALSAEFEAGRLTLAWLALVEGRVDRDRLTIDRPLGPDRRHPGRVRACEAGAKRSRPARTEVVTVEVFARHSLLRVVPLTDRGHQVRAHLASIHHPVVGDKSYGDGAPLLLSSFKRKYRPQVGVQERPLLARLALHAASLRRQSDAGEQEWTSPLPKDFAAALLRLRRYADR